MSRVEPRPEEMVAGVPPLRPQAHGILVTVGMAVAGPVVGSALARLLLADSVLAQALGFFALPLVFLLGYKVWLAHVAAAAMKSLFMPLLRAFWQIAVRKQRPDGKDVIPDRERLTTLVRTVLRAASAFTRMGWIIGVLNGAVAGVAAADGQFVAACAAFLLASGLYGRSLTRLARAGYLVIPDEI